MSKSKRKGDREERNIVNLFRALGFKAERTLESGARSDGSATWDLDIYLDGDTATIVECKLRSTGFKQIYNWLADNDMLTIRADRKDRLYVVPEWKLLELIGIKKSTYRKVKDEL